MRLDNERSPNDRSGFRVSRRPQYGRQAYLLALQKPGQQQVYTVCRPNTGVEGPWAAVLLCACSCACVCGGSGERGDARGVAQGRNAFKVLANWRLLIAPGRSTCHHTHGPPLEACVLMC